ncbi:1-aminocyclopropane-1-carboxylate deaminase/D-cysteine desulfhydrase [Christiangramia aquimixticola]|uniref:1-aminocyclopropane-1-carboxylate deaminase/D-cysteine desulfhydrase n=1 Tax=Christiangramia aquimixticola TaxID=1697558 RepID=UPI003AA87980
MDQFFKSNISAEIPNQFIAEIGDGCELWLKREDLLHPQVSGNKFRKLKYNLLEAQKGNYSSIITFGGAHSNHIAATAAAGKILGFKIFGIVRGEELENSKDRWSPTLKFAESCGMNFWFISREEYREKDSVDFLKTIREKYQDPYLIPEGGTNEKAIQGCSEILKEEDKKFRFVCSSVGTGGTLAGLINSSVENQQIFGFSSLKSNHLQTEISELVKKQNWKIVLDYHFGGYAKVDQSLIEFMNLFYKNYNIKLDPVYTGKLLFGIFDLAKKGYFPKGSKILAIHTGGLQGIEGMNQRLLKKNLPQIEY